MKKRKLRPYLYALQIIIFCTAATAILKAEEEKKELSSKEFLESARRPPGRNCWASMSGEAVHRRRGKDSVEAPLYLGIMLTPQRTLAQVVINGNEGYYVGQAYKAKKEATTIIPVNKETKDKSGFADFGIRPQDLTMSFLFWDFKKELARESVKGRDCRVFVLKNPEGDEEVKVYLSAEYSFPLKVEWFKDAYRKDAEPLRTLMVRNFRKENGLWLVSSLMLYGPGWKTRIDFDETNAGDTKQIMPKELFKQFSGDRTKKPE